MKAAAQHSSSELGSAFTLHFTCTVEKPPSPPPRGDERWGESDLCLIDTTKPRGRPRGSKLYYLTLSKWWMNLRQALPAHSRGGVGGGVGILSQPAGIILTPPLPGFAPPSLRSPIAPSSQLPTMGGEWLRINIKDQLRYY